jgi:hypothetical protein
MAVEELGVRNEVGSNIRVASRGRRPRLRGSIGFDTQELDRRVMYERHVLRQFGSRSCDDLAPTRLRASVKRARCVFGPPGC